MKSTFIVDLERASRTANIGIVLLCLASGVAGYLVSFYFHFLTVTFFLLVLLNAFWRHGQTSHALLANFGFLAQIRYLVESIGPEFRQYLFASDTEERPFNRVERAEVYRKAKGVDSSAAFGSLLDFDRREIKLRHSFYPVDKDQIEPFDVAVGESRNLETTYHIRRPIMISAMSYGALGENAVRALARGARLAGAVMNTGEGGTPKYHLMEGCDLIFQIGTAKFGVRTPEGHLDEDKLAAIAGQDEVKMIEIKLSQGAKPGKGGLLPKEKITPEIAELRGVPMDEDVISPAHHLECVDAESTVAFIGRVQRVGGLPTGIKFCLGRPDEFRALVQEMKRQDIVPDFITVDGAEGGTGAAPKSFMDDVGMPLFEALPLVHKALQESGLRDRLVLFASGKLINPGKQMTALSLGADAVYSARGFLLALGCIQALQCNRNTCPVGITTHQKKLQKGLDIEDKAQRVANYIEALHHDHVELLSAMGRSSSRWLSEENVYSPTRAPASPLSQEPS
ncbi:MAG: FMN-binding glutamate synthase family protein [Thermoanaerobaculia bacterium]|nr:FMN-binding glutamate synthase family protein [Thermoanaerobaculia bacterium]